MALLPRQGGARLGRPRLITQRLLAPRYGPPPTFAEGGGTLGALTVSAAAEEVFQAALAQTLGDLASSAAAEEVFQAAAAQTLDALTSSADGSQLVRIVELDSTSSNVDATTHATNALTIPANVPVYVAFLSVKATTPDTPTASSATVTWTEVKTQLISTTRRLTVFSGISATDVSEVVTADFTNTQLAFCAKAVKCPGAATTGYTVQSTSSNIGATGTTMTNSLAALGSANNVHLAFCATRRSGHTDIVPDGDFAETAADASATDGALLQCQWARNQTDVTPTWGAADLACTVSVEVKSG